jgi:DNA/RNA-binding domain of Phe-tRNA-synthetase-like protein
MQVSDTKGDDDSAFAFSVHRELPVSLSDWESFHAALRAYVSVTSEHSDCLKYVGEHEDAYGVLTLAAG